MMLNKKAQVVFLIATAFLFALGAGLALAQTQTTGASRVEQIFTLTSSDPATFSNPSGAHQPLDSMTVDLKYDSLLVINFSARGVVAPSTGPIPIVFIKCEIDGTPCQPNTNPVEFLYPQFRCDTRSFTWVVHSAAKGVHTITLHWGMGNATSAILTNRTLVVEAAVLDTEISNPSISQFSGIFQRIQNQAEIDPGFPFIIDYYGPASPGSAGLGFTRIETEAVQIVEIGADYICLEPLQLDNNKPTIKAVCIPFSAIVRVQARTVVPTPTIFFP